MLKIRFNRTGKSAQPSFRIVVQEHTAPIGGKFIESLGHFSPTSRNKECKINLDRVKHWISVGACPSDSVAVLLKREGFAGVEKYLEPRNKKRKSKKEKPEEAAAPTPAAPAAVIPAEVAVTPEVISPEPAPEAPAVEEAAAEPTPEEPKS